jgi:hypothetical protein
VGQWEQGFRCWILKVQGVGAGNVSKDFENSVSDFEVLIIKKH